MPELDPDLQSGLKKTVARFSALSISGLRAYCQEHNIKGVPEDPENCPFAVLLGRTLSPMPGFTIGVDLDDIYITDRESIPAAYMTTPPDIAAFIMHVDDGDYPELILEPQ